MAVGSICGGKGSGSRTSRSSNLAINLDFQSRRWTCHVPSAKAVIGIKAVFQNQ
jgi:hypothetical protein